MVNGRCVLGRKTKWGIIEGQFRDPREGSGDNRLQSEAQPLALAILTPARVWWEFKPRARKQSDLGSSSFVLLGGPGQITQLLQFPHKWLS